MATDDAKNVPGAFIEVKQELIPCPPDDFDGMAFYEYAIQRASVEWPTLPASAPLPGTVIDSPFEATDKHGVVWSVPKAMVTEVRANGSAAGLAMGRCVRVPECDTPLLVGGKTYAD